MPLTSSQYHDLEAKYGELQRHHDAFSRRITALDTDIGRELDSERRRIVTASDDGTVRIWFADIADLLAQAQTLIWRDPSIFAPEERQRYGLE